jgi:3-methyladenine DNA glycosylase AlkD
MTLDDVMTQLEAWGSEKAREINGKNGAGENQFGVNLSNVRTLAKQIKSNHELALQLWETGNVEATLLATLIIKPKLLSADDLDEMIGTLTYFKTTDWFVGNVVQNSPHKIELGAKWRASSDEYIRRAGWSLLTEQILKGSGVDLSATLDIIEAELKDAPYRTQEAMNHTLAEIGIHSPDYRARAIAIGEKLGVFKDYPVPKGCTSPYAPIWIAYGVEQQSKEA